MKTNRKSPSEEVTKPLSPKRARAAAEYVGRAKGNMAEAMRLAGYSEQTALHQATRLLNDPQVKAEIARLMEPYELSDRLATEKHAQLIHAQRHIRVGNQLVQVPDNPTQLGALELYYKLRGRLRPQYNELQQAVKHYCKATQNIVENYIDTPEKRQACWEQLIATLEKGDPQS